MPLRAAYPPRLEDPVRTPGQLQVRLHGETLGLYVLEASTNLLDWTPAVTNQFRAAQRSINVPAQGAQAYVRARRPASNPFRFGLAVKTGIDLNGHNLMMDSYDSGLGPYDPLTAGDMAEVALHGSLMDSAGDGVLTLFGIVNTPPEGRVILGPNWAVGSLPWIFAGFTGIEPGHHYQELTMAFPDVPPPFTGGAITPGPNVIDGTSYTYVLGDGPYHLSSLNLSSSQAMAVTGRPTLYVPGNVVVTGAARIVLFPGASLRLFVAGTASQLGGGGVQNPSAPGNFSIHGLPSAETLDLRIPEGTLSARIYAPDTDVTIGNGTGPVTLLGSCTARSLRLLSPVHLHQDQALDP